MFFDRLKKSGWQFWCWVGALFLNIINLLTILLTHPWAGAYVIFGLIVWAIWSIRYWWRLDNERIGYIE